MQVARAIFPIFLPTAVMLAFGRLAGGEASHRSGKRVSYGVCSEAMRGAHRGPSRWHC